MNLYRVDFSGNSVLRCAYGQNFYLLNNRVRPSVERPAPDQRGGYSLREIFCHGRLDLSIRGRATAKQAGCRGG